MKHRLAVILSFVLCVCPPLLATDYDLLNSPGSVDVLNNGVAVTDLTDVFSVYRFETNVGSYDVMIYNQLAPITATNFATYADGGTYTNNMFHRNLPGTAVQGGSFWDDNYAITPNATNDPIPMEWVGLSNVRGSMAMARTSDPDSATCGWFFSTKDNSVEWDDGGAYGPYAVFGEVLYDGMTVVDEINALGAYDLNAAWGWPTAFREVPLILDDPDTPDVDEFDLLWLRSVTKVTGLTYEIVGNTMGADLTSAVNGSELTLTSLVGTDATGNLTLRVTDAGGDSFTTDLSFATKTAGDMNGDDVVDESDIDLLAAAIRTGQTSPNFDVNGDGVVTTDDLVTQVGSFVDTDAGKGTFFADANLDGAVDELDLNVLIAGYHGTGGWASGDFDGDGIIGLLDLAMMGEYYGAGGGAPLSVPEPTTMGLLALGGLVTLRRRRR
jgi:cyclophilin family peptidyl-prolyl cis-trans isomerase